MNYPKMPGEPELPAFHPPRPDRPAVPALAFGILVETWIGDDTVNLRCSPCNRTFNSPQSPVDLSDLLRASATHAAECDRGQAATELPPVTP